MRLRVALFVGGVVVGAALTLLPGCRYQYYKGNQAYGQLYRVDRLTGQTWHTLGHAWERVDHR